MTAQRNWLAWRIGRGQFVSVAWVMKLTNGHNNYMGLGCNE